MSAGPVVGVLQRPSLCRLCIAIIAVARITRAVLLSTGFSKALSLERGIPGGRNKPADNCRKAHQSSLTNAGRVSTGAKENNCQRFRGEIAGLQLINAQVTHWILIGFGRELSLRHYFSMLNRCLLTLKLARTPKIAATTSWLASINTIFSEPGDCSISTEEAYIPRRCTKSQLFARTIYLYFTAYVSWR